MHTDSVTVAFLHLLQSDLLGQREQDPDEAEAVPRGALDGGALAGGDVVLEPTPTPYEPAIGYSILTELSTDIVAALRQDVELRDPPLMGTLPIGSPEALLLRVPGSSSHIAVLDREFTIFANLLAKACAQALLPPHGDASVEAWEASLQSGLHPAIQRYLELMFATLTGSPVAAPAYLPPPELSALLNQIRTAIEAFVVSEPIVHAALGHTVVAPPRPLSSLHPRAESYAWSEEQRAEAFVMRLGVVAWIFDKRGIPDKALGYWAIQMFLFTLLLLLEAEAAGDDEMAIGDSWPQIQLHWLKDVLIQSEGEQSRSIGLFDKLSPVPLALAKQFELALRQPDPGVH